MNTIKQAFFKFPFAILVILLVNTGCTTKKEANNQVIEKQLPPENPHLKQLIKDYDQYVESEINKNATPGAAVAIVHDQTILLNKGYGVKNIQKPDSINSKTIFRIGSLSKGFAAVLTGILVEDQLLEWNDPVVKYLPSFKLYSNEHTQNLTIRHILSHTTGLPRHAYTNLIEDGMSLNDIIRRLKNVSLISELGELYSYQNASYSLIDNILANAAGESYQKLMKQRIFRPLGMENASVSYQAMKNARNKALPHKKSNGDWHVQEISKKYYNASPAGGINASIDDMARWLRLLLGNSNLIQSQTLREIYEPVINTPIEYRYFKEWKQLDSAFYGMGWRVINSKNRKIIYHGGYVNGYRSEIAFIPDRKIGICVLTNSLNSFSNRCIPRFFEYYENYADKIEHWLMDAPEDSISQ